MTSVSEWKNNELFSPILITQSLDRYQFTCYILVALHWIFLAQQLPVGQGLLIHEVFRPHTTPHYSR